MKPITTKHIEELAIDILHLLANDPDTDILWKNVEISPSEGYKSTLKDFIEDELSYRLGYLGRWDIEDLTPQHNLYTEDLANYIKMILYANCCFKKAAYKFGIEQTKFICTKTGSEYKIVSYNLGSCYARLRTDTGYRQQSHYMENFILWNSASLYDMECLSWLLKCRNSNPEWLDIPITVGNTDAHCSKKVQIKELKTATKDLINTWGNL